MSDHTEFQVPYSPSGNYAVPGHVGDTVKIVDLTTITHNEDEPYTVDHEVDGPPAHEVDGPPAPEIAEEPNGNQILPPEPQVTLEALLDAVKARNGRKQALADQKFKLQVIAAFKHLGLDTKKFFAE